jgi:transposase InsO family protein
LTTSSCSESGTSVMYYCLTSNIIMRYARIYPWRRTRRSRALWNGPDAFFVALFLEGSTTNMSGFDLRQGHRPIAPRSPWQNAYVERLSGSIRRECLDRMIVFGEAHLRRVLYGYAAYYYYNVSRTHRSLNKDAPLHRAVERLGRRRLTTPWRPSPSILQNLIFGTHSQCGFA